MKWFFLTVPTGGKTNLRRGFPERGAYPHNIWARDGLSGGGYCGIGFGVASEEQKAAILWFYSHHLKAVDEKSETPFDAASPYPHHAILSFVNWPFGLKEKDPGEVLPHAYRDTVWGFYAWRNRWKDENDVVISILTRRARGNFSVKAENTLTIQAMGRKMQWGRINGGFKDAYEPRPDGSTVVTTGDGSCLAVDFSGASGADAMLVMTGPGAPTSGTIVEAEGRKFSFLFLTKGKAPEPKRAIDKIIVGEQMVRFDGKKIVLAK